MNLQTCSPNIISCLPTYVDVHCLDWKPVLLFGHACQFRLGDSLLSCGLYVCTLYTTGSCELVSGYRTGQVQCLPGSPKRH